MITTLRASALFALLALNACAATSSGRTFREPGAGVGTLGPQPGGFDSPRAAADAAPRVERNDFESRATMTGDSAGIRDVRDRGDFFCVRCN